MLGCIYIPPENSRFFTNEDFELFEDSVSDICNNYKYVMITGDANSRTAQLHDFVRPDSFLFDFFFMLKQTTKMILKNTQFCRICQSH